MRLANTICRLVVITWLWSEGWRLSAAEVAVFAAASLTESLKEIGSEYLKQSGDRIVFNFGASSTLARQIEEGAPADIFLSADEPQMDRLEERKLIVPETRRNLLSNSLVIIVSAIDGARIRSPADLARTDIKRVALGDPRVVPIGVYARKYLEQEGLWQAVAPKVVPTENVRGALAAVESGNADASIVYQTDALTSKKVVIAYRVPIEAGPPIHYPVALVLAAKEPTASKRFLNYLTGESAAKKFENAGFLLVRKPELRH